MNMTPASGDNPRRILFLNNQLLIFESSNKGFNAFIDQENFSELNDCTNKVIKLVNSQKK